MHVVWLVCVRHVGVMWNAENKGGYLSRVSATSLWGRSVHIAIGTVSHALLFGRSLYRVCYTAVLMVVTEVAESNRNCGSKRWVRLGVVV